MALIKCPECKKEISEEATQCIHCGCPIENETKHYCKECGTEILETDETCKKCGCSLKKANKKNTFLGIIYILLGLVSIIWGLQLNYYGDYSKEEKYGGDAYTGIQNASSTTANNVNELGDMLCLSFKGILIVMGGTIILYGVSTISNKEGN